MIVKDGVRLRGVEHDFYGDVEGSCAWCNKPVTTKWYIKETPWGNNAVYNVCGKCYNEGIGQ